MRTLAVDFGSKRIGLAVGEGSVKVVSPRPALRSPGTLSEAASLIRDRARQEEAELVVVGIPFHEEDMRRASVSQKLVDLLVALGLNVSTVDETLTSVAASASLADHDWTAATIRKHKDGEAACQILERYWHENP